MTLTLDPGAKLTEPEVVTEPVTANGVLTTFTLGVFSTFTPTVGGPCWANAPVAQHAVTKAGIK